jgi:hypothetical protein
LVADRCAPAQRIDGASHRSTSFAQFVVILEAVRSFP